MTKKQKTKMAVLMPCKTEQFNKMTMRVDQALDALKRTGCLDDPKKPFFKKDLGKDPVDFYKFCNVAVKSRHLARVQFRENGGFTEEQVKELLKTFKMYDSSGDGHITGQDSLALFETEFAVIAKDPSKRPKLLELLKEAQEDGKKNALTFHAFLRIVREVRDIQDQARIAKELDAVKDTAFSPPEVQEFRDLFLATGHGQKTLYFQQARELLKCIVPMGTKNTDDLRKKWEGMAKKHHGPRAETETLDFPEFLRFMRMLIDADFGGMSAKAAVVVKEAGLSTG